jgi:hypothetical protein
MHHPDARLACAFAQGLLTTSSVMVAFEFTAQKLHPAAVAASQIPDTLALMVLAGAFAGSVLGSLVLSVGAQHTKTWHAVYSMYMISHLRFSYLCVCVRVCGSIIVGFFLAETCTIPSDCDRFYGGHPLHSSTVPQHSSKSPWCMHTHAF